MWALSKHNVQPVKSIVTVYVHVHVGPRKKLKSRELAPSKVMKPILTARMLLDMEFIYSKSFYNLILKSLRTTYTSTFQIELKLKKEGKDLPPRVGGGGGGGKPSIRTQRKSLLSWSTAAEECSTSCQFSDGSLQYGQVQKEFLSGC